MSEQGPTGAPDGGGPDTGEPGESRRDFLYLATATFAAVGGAIAIWPSSIR